MEIIDSPMHSFDFCLGYWSAMGFKISDAIAYFGRRNKYSIYISGMFKGVIPKFRECFVDEGNSNMVKVL